MRSNKWQIDPLTNFSYVNEAGGDWFVNLWSCSQIILCQTHFWLPPFLPSMDGFIYLLPECSLKALRLRCPNKSHTRLNARSSTDRTWRLTSSVSSCLFWIPERECAGLLLFLSVLSIQLISARWNSAWMSVFIRFRHFLSTISESENLRVKVGFVKIPSTLLLARLWMWAAASLSRRRTFRCVLLQEEGDLSLVSHCHCCV